MHIYAYWVYVGFITVAGSHSNINLLMFMEGPGPFFSKSLLSTVCQTAMHPMHLLH